MTGGAGDSGDVGDTGSAGDSGDAGDTGDAAEGELRERLRTLARRARADRRAFDPPDDPPDEERAVRYLTEGAGQAIGLYVHARTGGRFVQFDADELATLEAAMNTWLSCYAACYGTALDADVSIRTAAEALIETEDVRDTAALLTGVPDR